MATEPLDLDPHAIGLIALWQPPDEDRSYTASILRFDWDEDTDTFTAEIEYDEADIVAYGVPLDQLEILTEWWQSVEGVERVFVAQMEKQTKLMSWFEGPVDQIPDAVTREINDRGTFLTVIGRRYQELTGWKHPNKPD